MHPPLRDRPNRAEEGMSIVEVRIGSVILLVALTAMLGLLMTSTGLSAKARAEALAVKTASAFLEKVRALPYANLTQTRLNSMAYAASGTLGGLTVAGSATMSPRGDRGQATSAPPPHRHVRVRGGRQGPAVAGRHASPGAWGRSRRPPGQAVPEGLEECGPREQRRARLSAARPRSAAHVPVLRGEI